jgi:hypothetical protein
VILNGKLELKPMAKATHIIKIINEIKSMIKHRPDDVYGNKRTK